MFTICNQRWWSACLACIDSPRYILRLALGRRVKTRVMSIYFQAQKIEIEDESGPLWFEHPELGSVCDVVAIPVHKPTDWPSFIHVAANKIDETSVPIEPGLKVTVIGFPQGMSTGPGLPVMKTGFLSSMPGYDERLGGKFSDIGGMKNGVQVPAMLLDVHTIPGMSGSPVFGEYTGFWNPDDLSTSEVTKPKPR